MADVYKLVYLSFSKGEIKEDLIDTILEKAHKNNPELNITGVLLHQSGVFLQLLEGPKKNVRQLFDKISSDDRHEKIKVICETIVENRLFSDWSMASGSLSEIDIELINSILKLGIYEDERKRPEQDDEFINQILGRFKQHLEISA